MQLEREPEARLDGGPPVPVDVALEVPMQYASPRIKFVQVDVSSGFMEWKSASVMPYLVSIVPQESPDTTV